jgi:hypothetical protein
LAPFQALTLAKNIAQSRHKDHPRQNRATCMLNGQSPPGGVTGHLARTIWTARIKGAILCPIAIEGVSKRVYEFCPGYAAPL